MKKIGLCLFSAVLFFIPAFTAAQDQANVEVKIFDSNGSFKKSFFALFPDYKGNVDLTLANSGKEKQIIVSRGSSNSPIVEVYNSDGVFDRLFDAFDSNFKGGSFISAGDVDGDGQDEIVVGAGYRGGPQIRIFKGTENISNFFAYNKEERSGVKVLVADLTGDGKAEIIAGPNLNHEPVINVFDYKGKKLKSQKLDLNSTGGVDMAAGDINGDGKNELIIGSGYGNNSQVLILDSELKQIAKFNPFGKDYQGGVNVAAGDLNGDGVDEIAVAPAFHGYYVVKIVNSKGELMKEFTPYDKKDFYGGVDIQIGDLDGDGQSEIVTIPQRVQAKLKSDAYKFIEVDLNKQTLSYWQDGRKLDTFLISSGKTFPTPKGEFKIYKKRPSVRMSWYYGAGSRFNYDLPNVPWVSSFSGPYTIHGTYWHHNFGHPMSHGCVNMYTPHAKLIYDWVDIGTPIIIY